MLVNSDSSLQAKVVLTEFRKVMDSVYFDIHLQPMYLPVVFGFLPKEVGEEPEISKTFPSTKKVYCVRPSF